MSDSILRILLYFLVAGAVFWIAFCRLTLTDTRTRLRTRLLFWALGAGALLSVTLTLGFGYLPGWPHIAALASALLWQMRNAQHWSNGVPKRYQKACSKGRDGKRCWLTSNF